MLDVLDSHIHAWDTSRVRIGWLAPAGMPSTAEIPEAPPHPGEGQREYVLVEADADDPAQEAEWLIRQVQHSPQIHGAVVGAPVESAEGRTLLNDVADKAGVVGIRRLLQDRHLYESRGLLEGLRAVAETGLPFDACVRAVELSQLCRLLEKLPELTVVLDHMGKPPVGDVAGMRRWKEDLQRIAELPTVHCKISGLPAECRDQADLDEVAHDVVASVIGIFGAHRCLVGSDQPVSRDQRDWCRRVLDQLPSDQQPGVASQNAHRIYVKR